MKIAEALLEREILDGNEVMQIIKGETLPPAAAAGGKDAEDHTQQVLRPEGGRRVPGPLRRGASAAGVIPRFPVYLFDIDGTLLDSARISAARSQQVLDANGAGDRDFEFLKSFIGLHLIDLFQDVFPALRRARRSTR